MKMPLWVLGAGLRPVRSVPMKLPKTSLPVDWSPEIEVIEMPKRPFPEITLLLGTGPRAPISLSRESVTVIPLTAFPSLTGGWLGVMGLMKPR